MLIIASLNAFAINYQPQGPIEQQWQILDMASNLGSNRRLGWALTRMSYRAKFILQACGLVLL